MKVLFSPSEAKYKGGVESNLSENSFIFPELFEHRKKAFQTYKDFINDSSLEQLKKLFGTKKEDVVEYYKSNVDKYLLQKVISRYDGVAFDYLAYPKLNENQKKYIDENVLIFSNLFGPILAGDVGIPDYKLKQGEKLDTFVLESFYKEHFSNALDNYLEDDDILDLRAGFYEKFYKITKPYTSMKFIKNGKVVSHYAKAYRGIVLKLMAENSIENIGELMNMEIENLSIVEIKRVKLKSEIIYEINE